MYMCDEVCVYMCGHSEIDVKGSVYIYICVYMCIYVCVCVIMVRWECVHLCGHGEIGMYTYV